jgi:hypothetical protein
MSSRHQTLAAKAFALNKRKKNVKFRVLHLQRNQWTSGVIS